MKIFTLKQNKILKAVISVLFWLCLWAVAAAAVGQKLILPSPLDVAKSLVRLCVTSEFRKSVAVSILSISAGFVLGAVIGFFTGALTSSFGLLDAILSPAVRIVRATPVASFIVIALLWMGKLIVPGFISALMVIPVVCGAVTSAVKSVDGKLLEMADAYRFGKLKKLRLIYIPGTLTHVRGACITSLGLAWKAGVAAEVLCQLRPSLGGELYYAKISLETSDMFAWTAVVILLSFVLEKVIARLMKGRKDA